MIPGDGIERRTAEPWVTHAELFAALQASLAQIAEARHVQTNQITTVIVANHLELNQQLAKLRFDILAADAEPQATPSGRRLLDDALTDRKRLDDHNDRLEDIERWRDELRGALTVTITIARFAFGASLISALASAVAIWKALNP